ncbi:MAG: thiolase family protein [Firmicutes bacterium]|nr:thiolase family protein [Bacillota bacterium]
MVADDVAIIGVGEVNAGKNSGRNALELGAQAAFLALADAGVEAREIDAVLVEHPMSDPHHMPAHVFLEYVHLRPRLAVAVSAGGASPHAMVIQAASLIVSGVARTVLVVDADGRSTRFQGDKGQAMVAAANDIEEWEWPYGTSVPGRYGLIAQRHMAEYGTRPEHLAQVAVIQRRHAALHPDALYRSPLTIEEVLASPMVASPFHLLECCLVSDWGSALVLTAGADARRSPKPPVWIRGFGACQQGYNLAPLDSLTRSPIHQSAAQAYQMAGIRPDDVDFAQVYDSFPITVLLALEGLGFCRPGESGPYVMSGAIALGGEHPVNTHGGQLSYGCGHGQYLVESVRQLRGEAGARQVPHAQWGVSQGTAALCSASYTVILAKG